MRGIGLLGVLLSLAGLCQAQTQCTVSTAPPPIARQEGVTELVADVLLTCIGGTPTPMGQTIPQVALKLTLNTAVTSKLLSNGGSEALLLIDDPLGPDNSTTPQVGCTSIITGCPVQGTGGATNPFTLPGNPNVFEGRQSSPNVLEWDGIPLDPAPNGASRLLRITNVRANANQLGVGGAVPAQVSGFISFAGSPANLFLSNPQHTLASIQPGLSVSTVATPLLQCPAVNGGNIYNPIPSGHGAIFHLLIHEQFPNAFKRQTIANDLNHPDAPLVVQNLPGQIPPYVESGFIPDPKSGLPAEVGTVNFGSVIQVNVAGLPTGVNIQVPATIPLIISGSPAGYAVTWVSGGTTVGTQVQFTPSAGTGVAVFYLNVVETPDLTTALKLLDLTVSLVGQAATLPASIQATASFVAVSNPQTTLFALDSPNAPPRPIFQNAFDTGLAAAYSPYWAGASVSDCNNQSGTLSTSSMGAVTFIEGSGPPAPVSDNLDVISSGPAVPGVVVSTDTPAPWLHVTLSQTTTPLTATFSVNPTGGPATLSTNVIFNAPGSSSPLTVPVSFTITPAPHFIRYGIAQLGSYVNSVVAPGEPFVLFGGNDFGPTTLAGATLDSGGLVTTALANTQVFFESIPAPLVYAVDANGLGQVAGFVPFALDGKSQTSVQVIYNSVASPAVIVPVVDAVPGLFTVDQSGGGQGAILNQDLSSNGPGNPESVGNVVTLYGGGAGQTTPAGRDGAFGGVGQALPTFRLAVKVFVDGILATDVPYAGPAPQMEEGLFQINVRIPQGVHSPGNLSVSVQIGDKVTQPGVTLAVK